MVPFIKSHGAALALYKKKSPRVSLVQPVETRFASIFMMLTCLLGRRDSLEAMLHDDAWASIPWERRLLPQARWVHLQIRDGEFWRYVEFLILVMEPIHQLLRRMDRGGMMMSIVYEWIRHLVQLLTKLDVVPADLLTPCMREVRMRLMHLLEPAHAAAPPRSPHRQSLRYYASLHTTTEDVEVVQECDRFLLVQTGGEPTSRDYLVVRDQMRRFHARSGDWGDRLVSEAEAEGCHGDQETHHCAAWQQGGGYVLPWVMDGVDTERRLPNEDEDGYPEPDVWGARPVGEGSAAAAEDGEDDWTDAKDVAGGTDRTAEQVYFTYVAGSDGHAPWTSVITDDVAGGAQGSATRHPPAGQGHGAVSRDVHPRARRVLGVNSSDEGEGVAPHADRLRDPRLDPSHHSTKLSEQLRRSHRVHDRAEYRTDVREREETIEERDARLDREEESWLQSMPRWEGREAYEAEQRRKRELETIGAGPPSSVGRMPTSDTMQPPSRPSDVVGGGAHTCGLDAGGGGQADVPCEGGPVGGVEIVGADTGAESSDDGEECEDAEATVDDVVIGICAAGTDGGTHGREEGMVDKGNVPLPEEELVDEGSVRLPQEELDEGDLALPEEELVDEGSVPLEGGVPFIDGTTQDDEEGAAVDAGHSAPSVRDGVTGGHVEEVAAIDMSLAIIVRPPSVQDVERGWHIDSGGPGSFSAGGQFGEMPWWDGGEPGECTSTPLHPEQLERLGTEDPFPFTGGQPSPPPWALVSPRWTGSSQSDIRERESLESQAAVFSGGPGSSHVQPLTHPISRASQLTTAPAASLPPIGGRGSGRGSSSSHRGGVLWGWSSCRRVTDSQRRDYDRGRGLFARGPSGEGDPAAGASEVGRPSVHTAGHILGLDRVETRRTERLEVYPARSAIDDRRQGLPYTSGEEDLHMPQGSRRHGSIRDLDAEIAADQQRLADLIPERERRLETEAQAEEADTEIEPIDTTMRRERHRRVASAAGSHLAPVGREGAPHDRGRGGRRGALAGRGSATRHSTHTRRGSRG
ncbi:hypothetical protein CBR_g9204 [Chara braunii]|uniref:Uncharacterized protein n=1 Tax=Chara braunii TaxID=69332 RepID=A0A388KP33_CHABU|nr:hypothetical protein CBR_g9204 [Chara braunii]|eukprot:GBG71795.1 hypothetical protein CBR_g9204 [Chara braunii]